MNYSDLNLTASSPKFQVSYIQTAKSVTIGTAVSLFSTVVFLAFFALVINAMFGDPDSVLNIFTGIGASIGAVIGGFRASRINGSSGFAVGLTTGISTSIIIFIIMLFSSEPASASVEKDVSFRLIMVLCNIFFSCIGGIFAVNSGRSKKISSYSHRKNG